MVKKTNNERRLKNLKDPKNATLKNKLLNRAIVKNGTILYEKKNAIVNLMDLSSKDFSQSQKNTMSSDRVENFSRTTKLDDDLANGGFKMSSDGRLIITCDSEKISKKTRTINKVTFDDDEDNDDCKSSTSDESDNETSFCVKKKPSMSDSCSMKSGMSQQSAARSTKRGIYRNESETKCRPSAKKGNMQKGGNGDVKKANKVDPYVYIPMNRQFLNKRKRSIASRQLLSSIKQSKNNKSTKKKQK